MEPARFLASPVRKHWAMSHAHTAERGEAVSARHHLPVCLLDDDPAMLALVTEYLERMGFPVFATSDPYAALDRVRTQECRVVVSDLKMPEMDGLQFLEKAQEINPEVSVILLTGFYSVDSAIDAIKRGAYDYLRRQHIQRVLEMCRGNRVRAAEMLGIGRTSLYRFLKRENSAA